MKIRSIIFFVFLFSDVSLFCMDKKLPSDVLPQLIKISVLDGIFALEKWKVLQSRSLIPCLKDEKNALKFAISIKAMRLFSNALDVPPGHAFKEHIGFLPKRDRDLLITVAGEYDKNKKQQLNAPLLTAQLAEACFSPAVCAKICSYVMGDDDIKNSFINHMIQNNSLPYEKFSSKAVAAFVSKTIVIEGIEWHARSGIAIDKDRKYQLTPSVSSVLMGSWDKKKCLLWLLDDANKVLSKVPLECEDDKKVVFSGNGQHMVTYSNKEIVIFKIVLSKNIISLPETRTLYHTETMQADWLQGVCFSPNFRMIASWSFNKVKSFLKIWNSLGNRITRLDFDGSKISQAEFNRDGNRLLVRTIPCLGSLKEQHKITIYDTANILIMRPLATYSYNAFEPAVYGPLGDMWMIPTGESSIIFIRNTLDGCASKSYSLYPNGYFLSRPVLAVCSPDNKFFVATVPGSLGIVTIIWSALTGDRIKSFVKDSSENVRGIDVMPDGRSLLYTTQIEKTRDYKYYRRLLYSDKDAQLLEYIMENATLSELVVYRRLLLGNKNKEMVELYSEEPAYKVLEGLLSKEHNMKKFIKDYVCWYVINNKPVKKRSYSLRKKH